MRLTFRFMPPVIAPLEQITLELDWSTGTWGCDPGTPKSWQRLCNASAGSFELMSNDVIWIHDSSAHRIILRAPPRFSADVGRTTGLGRLFAPVDTTLRDVTFTWAIEPSPSVKTAPAMSDRRIALLKELQSLMPCAYPDQKFAKVAMGLTPQGGGYTSCGSLPGYVSWFLGAMPLPFSKREAYILKYSLNGTNLVRIKGKKYGAWETGGQDKRPKPGDIYALLNYGKTDVDLDGISHVGVIVECSGDTWLTCDLGQGAGGFEGKYDITRPYKSASNELFGETNQGGGYRVLAGWVDIDRYFGP